MTFNIYLIYKFEDGQALSLVKKAVEDYNLSVDQQKEKYGRKADLFFFTDMGDGVSKSSDGFLYKDDWKEKAEEKIKYADVICLFLNGDKNEDYYYNIKWEYSKAKEFDKKVIFISDEHPLTEGVLTEFFSENCYGTVQDRRSKFEDANLFDDAKWKVKNRLLIEDSSDLENKDRELYYTLLLEQYKLMIDTSEKLMDRRQNISNLYTTICTALVAIIGSTFALESRFATSMIFLCVGVLLVIIPITWIAQLNSFGKNNEGKYEVINTIEAKLPANMFDSEYIYNKKKGIKSYAKREKWLPNCFIIVGGLFIFISFILLVLL